MNIIEDKVKRIRKKPIIEVKKEDGSIFKRQLIIYGQDLVTVTLTAENKEYLEIKDFVQGEKNPKKEAK
jgi:hypothetical protein